MEQGRVSNDMRCGYRWASEVKEEWTMEEDTVLSPNVEGLGRTLAGQGWMVEVLEVGHGV